MDLEMLPPRLCAVQLRGVWVDVQRVSRLTALACLTSLDLQRCHLDGDLLQSIMRMTLLLGGRG